jgi:TonB family protein
MKKFVFITLVCFWFSLNVFAQAKIKVFKYEVPKYAPTALATRKKGEVIVNVKIDKTGKVVSTKVESGHAFLAKTSEEAASKWLFSTDKNSKSRKLQVIFEYRVEIGNASYKFKPTNIKTRFKKPFRLIITATVFPTIQI